MLKVSIRWSRIGVGRVYCVSFRGSFFGIQYLYIFGITNLFRFQKIGWMVLFWLEFGGYCDIDSIAIVA